MNDDPAIVPPPLLLEEADEDLPALPAPRRWWVRALLVTVALGWLGVFAIAAWLNPYQGNRVWFAETHTQLGLPSCHFKAIAGVPCPSCGMTSSFALLLHGDLVNSLRANCAGTMLALLGLGYLPWSILSIVRGRWLFFRNVENVLIGLVFGFVGVMLLRWGIVLAWHFFGG
jgi:hypothetical protein